MRSGILPRAIVYFHATVLGDLHPSLQGLVQRRGGRFAVGETVRTQLHEVLQELFYHNPDLARVEQRNVHGRILQLLHGNPEIPIELALLFFHPRGKNPSEILQSVHQVRPRKHEFGRTGHAARLEFVLHAILPDEQIDQMAFRQVWKRVLDLNHDLVSHGGHHPPGSINATGARQRPGLRVTELDDALPFAFIQYAECFRWVPLEVVGDHKAARVGERR
mmetsp:Transcript_13694/g.39106  ORF Transcript_13694/g.39106 Transcript_13694/m.39106 type:complete len:220 (+) Transcript_13694:756-1415(+)